MKGTLSFNLPEEQEEFRTACDAGKYKYVLWEIAQQVFRPARKHGYCDNSLQELLDKVDEITVPAHEGDIVYETGAGTELVSRLEKLFYQILEEEGIKL